MTSGISIFQVCIGIDSGLLEFVVGHEMPAGGIDVAKSKGFSFQVSQGMNGRIRSGDEQGMKLKIAGPLHQRDHAILTVCLYISKTAQIGEIERAVSQSFDCSVVVCRNDQVYILSQAL